MPAFESSYFRPALRFWTGARGRWRSASTPARHVPRVLLPASLLTGDFLSLAAEALMQFSLTWYFLTRSRNPIWIAILTSAVFLPLALGGLFSGILVQRVGARKLIVLSKIATAAIFLCTAVMFAARVLSLDLLVTMAIANYSLTAVSLSAPASRVLAFTRWSRLTLIRYNSYRSAIYIVAPLLGVTCAGLIVDTYSVLPVLVIAGLLSLASLLVTLFVFPRDRVISGRKLTLTLWKDMTRRTVIALRKSEIGAPLLFISICLLAVQLTFRGMILPTEVQTRGWSASSFSAVSIAAAALSVFGTLAAPLAKGRIRFAKLVAITCVVLCGTLFYIGVSHSSSRAGLLVVVALPGLALGVLAPIYMSHLQESVPSGLVAHCVGCANALPMAISPVLMVAISMTLAHHREAVLVGLAGILLVTGLSVWRR